MEKLRIARRLLSKSYSTKPVQGVEDTTVKIDDKTIVQLERLSLVDFGKEEGIRRLEDAIRFAEKLQDVRVDDYVKPMYTVLEDEILPLREDLVQDGGILRKVLKNAVLTEEEYFVAPPGNIPIEPKADKY